MVAVNRLVAKGETFEVDLTLDIASEIYPIEEGEKFTMALASTLRLDGLPDDGTYDQSGVVSGSFYAGKEWEKMLLTPPRAYHQNDDAVFTS